MTNRPSNDELRRLASEATPGPWQHRGHWVFPAPGDESGFVAMCGDDARGHDDAAYIVAACNAVPALLDELEAQDAQLAEAQATLERVCRKCCNREFADDCMVCGVRDTRLVLESSSARAALAGGEA